MTLAMEPISLIGLNTFLLMYVYMSLNYLSLNLSKNLSFSLIETSLNFVSPERNLEIRNFILTVNPKSWGEV